MLSFIRNGEFKWGDRGSVSQTTQRFVVPGFEQGVHSYGVLAYDGSINFHDDKEIQSYVSRYFSGEMDEVAFAQIKLFETSQEAINYLRKTNALRLRYVFCFEQGVEEMKQILKSETGFGSSITCGFDADKYAQCNTWAFNNIPPSEVKILTHKVLGLKKSAIMGSQLNSDFRM